MSPKMIERYSHVRNEATWGASVSILHNAQIGGGYETSRCSLIFH
jgi:hypothetical protein